MELNGYQFEIEPTVKVLIDNYDNDKYSPKKCELFKALELTSLNDVKVVILGQDPYPTKGDAMGLSFSVTRNNKLPKSLINIFKELENDLGIERTDGNLEYLAKQGVLLLNTILSVEVSKANSHRKLGWQTTTDQIIKQVAKRGDIIFILLGKQAQSYQNLIGENNYIINSPHPSPLSAYRGFFGSKIFSKTNEILIKLGREPINW